MRLRRRLGLGLLMAAAALALSAATAGAVKHHRNRHVIVVCKHGCRFSSIQRAVNHSGKGWTILIRPGKYVQGAIVSGHKHDGLTIRGTGKTPRKVILEGKNAHTRNGLAQNAIEGENVNHLRILNMTGRHFASNGFFIHGCNGYLMKDLIAAFNRSYGLFAFHCTGGRMTESVGYGQGDSAFYVGETPPQARPRWTSLDHLDGHLNVLGYSGTNSKYVNIHDSAFYNNGIGVTPNTLDSEKFEPTSKGVIQDNDIFWNNLNYYLPNSPVQTVSGGLGCLGANNTPPCLNYPTGIGVVLFGATGWTVKNNRIFGNFLWGSAAFSDPFNTGDNAISTNNRFLNNLNGRGGTDTNGTDFFVDGSGSGNCFSGNNSATVDHSASASDANLYPTCPAPPPPASGTGASLGDPEQQFTDLLNVVGADPPSKQECFWTEHSHPAFKSYHPFEVTPKPSCP
jgi:hypothetical protein